nr:MAG TPA: hypothetical protein [Caudoviricetes sp.]
MIKTENGHTTIEGRPATLLADCSCINEAVKNAFVENGVLPENEVRKQLHVCVDDAFKSETALADELADALGGLLKKFFSDGGDK